MAQEFTLVSPFALAGDQPKATEALARGVLRGDRTQTLLGVTGSGKTMAMARTIELVQKPTLVLCHNKTLAAQLFAEFRDFFPNNAVAYFVSYYDYYQPEAYIPQRDIYIEKDASINEEIDRLRLMATSALVSRRDVIVVASVSCIYGLGSPKDYLEMMVPLRVGDVITKINGEPATSAVQLQELTLTKKPGDTVQLEVWRDGQTSTATVTLGTQP